MVQLLDHRNFVRLGGIICGSSFAAGSCCGIGAGGSGRSGGGGGTAGGEGCEHSGGGQNSNKLFHGKSSFLSFTFKVYRRFVPGSAGAGNQFARRHRSRMVVMLCFFMVLLLFVVCAGYNKSPCTEIAFCARADQSNNLWCHLACCAINCTAALRRTNIPLPCNGGFRQRILSPAFPRALGEPFIHSAYHPVPSIGGSLCVRLWFYFRFIGLKYL